MSRNPAESFTPPAVAETDAVWAEGREDSVRL